ncbi:MAG: hypothetical protein R3310_13680, partial [Candidatus Competibacteraceae bacterium]|nr:hypothetical protein [Candidatus Competibacteraceae bacterium]
MKETGILRINLLETFEAMLAAVSHFSGQVRSESLPAWVSRSQGEQERGVEMRAKAADVYQ